MIKDLRINVIIEVLDGNALLYRRQEQVVAVEGRNALYDNCDLGIDNRTKLTLDRIQRIIDEDFT